MNYRIEKKEEFTVIANAKTFAYENAKEIIPQFWHEHYASDKSQAVCGEFGINIDEMMGMDTFEYLIADTFPMVLYYAQSLRFTGLFFLVEVLSRPHCRM